MRRALITLLTLAVAATLVLIGLVVRDTLHTPRPHTSPRPAAQRVLARQVPAQSPMLHRKHYPPPAVDVAVGHALATLRIPRFGPDWSWTTVQGTADPQIAQGPGHYLGTALMGQEGNSAWAGHRAGHGDPFIDFDKLRPGDQVIFTQGTNRWVYQLTTRPRIIPPTAMWVLNPLPGHRLTLTTCWPKYGSSKRMFVHGTLVDFSTHAHPDPAQEPAA